MWGEDLKADLKALNDHYSALPDTEKEKGIIRFTANPPKTGNFLVSQLWDRYKHSWRGKDQPELTGPEKERKFVDHLKRFTNAPTLPTAQVDFDPDDADVLSLERMAHKRKGSWWQLPKNLKNTNDA